MRILVLSKRQYTGKDLLDDRYGRLFEIPAELSKLGHQIHGVALSYRPRSEEIYRWEDFPNMEWSSHNMIHINKYRKYVEQIICDFKPHLIWASSDAFHAIWASRLGKVFSLPYFIDLYDNYESFLASRIPGVVPLLREVCRKAAGVIAVSETLADWVFEKYKLKKRPQIIGNGVSKKSFYKRDRIEARCRLALPETGKLIGTAGSITRNRGIRDLFEAFSILAKTDPNLWLVIAGPRDRTINQYQHQRVMDLGVLDSVEVPYFFSALDVAVICNKNSAFGRYCFPQKLSEIIACETQFVATNIGELARLLSRFPGNLYEPDQPGMLAERILQKINVNENLERTEILIDLEWWQCAAKLEKFFLNTLGS